MSSYLENPAKNNIEATRSLVPQKRKADHVSQVRYTARPDDAHLVMAITGDCSEHFTGPLDHERASNFKDAGSASTAAGLGSRRNDAEGLQHYHTLDRDEDDNNSTDLEDYLNYIPEGESSKHDTDDINEAAHIAILQEEETIREEAEIDSKAKNRRHDGLASVGFREGQPEIFEEEEEVLAEAQRAWEDAFRRDLIEEEIRRDADSIVPTKDDTYFESRIRSRHLQLSSSTYQKALCHDCRAVDWCALARLTLTEPRTVYTRRGSPLSLQGLRCRLCKFLGRIGSGTSHIASSLDGTIEFELILSTPEQGDARILSVALNGAVAQSLITIHSFVGGRDWKPRIIRPDSVDYDALGKNHLHCCKVHRRTCEVKKGTRLHGFKVIDCKNHRVVPAPSDCDYVALSYVWGRPSGSDDYVFPVVVEDSIRVTKNMGFRYLWVDRHCIDQSDKSEKHRFIQNMDQIYTQAQLTIVDAAGKNPHYGLPGVGSRPRSLMDCINFGKVQFMRQLRLGVDIPKSPWWTRAWTYQEGVLSRRKLIFTDHQVFYVCSKMILPETLTVRHGIESFTDPVAFNGITLSSGPTAYVSFLNDISKRSLSHPSDALNACLGILKATNTIHIWGTPIVPHRELRYEFALCWQHKAVAPRRHQFPSWSWVGWAGGVNFENCFPSPKFVEVLLDDEQGNVQLVSKFRSNGQAAELAGAPNAPKLLHITGSVLDAALLESQWPDIVDFGTSLEGHQDDWLRPRFGLSFEGLSAICVLYMDQDMRHTDDLCDVIALGMQLGRDECCISALLLKPRGKYFTRVGMIHMTCESRTCERPYGSHVFWEQNARVRTVIVE